MFNSSYLKSTATAGDEGINMLIYGRSGVGKTPLLATAPNPLIISGEKGLLSLRRNNPPLPVAEFQTEAQLIDIFNWAASSQEAKQFYTLCLDSISETSEVQLHELLKKHKDPRKAYGELATAGMSLLRAFRDLPWRSKVIIAKEQYDKDETTGMMVFQPWLPGQQLPQRIPYLFDETFQMLVGKDAQQQDVRYLRTKLTAQHIARDRSGMLAEYEPAHLTYVFSKILGTLQGR